jgi:hypothetical protein
MAASIRVVAAGSAAGSAAWANGVSATQRANKHAGAPDIVVALGIQILSHGKNCHDERGIDASRTLFTLAPAQCSALRHGWQGQAVTIHVSRDFSHPCVTGQRPLLAAGVGDA